MNPLAPRRRPVPVQGETFTLGGVRPAAAFHDETQTSTLAVSGGRIQPPGSVSTREDRRFEGCVLTPGLCDVHLHLPAANALELSPLFANLLLAHGVTSVRDAGDGDGTAVPTMRLGAQRGRWAAPRIVACGPFVARAPLAWPNTVGVTDARPAADVVAEAQRRGAQALKLYDGLTTGDIAALTHAAHERGLPTIGHVPAGLDYVTAGVEHVQHFHGVPRPDSIDGRSLFDRLADWRSVEEQRLDQVVAATLEQGIRNTPTLVVTEGVLRAQQDGARDDDARLLPSFYPDVVWDRRTGLAAYRDLRPDQVAMLRDSLQLKLELVGRLHRAGAPLFLGTDVQQPYVVPGASLHREMRLFSEAGVPVAEIWRRATVAAGAELATGAGSLAPGSPADALVFREDPTVRLDALRSLVAVIADGRLLTVEDLRAAIDRDLAHYRAWPIEPIARRAAGRAMRRVAGSVR